MKIKSNYFTIALALFAFSVLNAQFSTALAQTTNIVITYVNRSITLSVGAGTYYFPEINLTFTNLGAFDYDNSEAASDPAFGASASGSVSQSGLIMLENDPTNILYVTGSAAASGSAEFFFATNYASGGYAYSESDVYFTLNVTCRFTLQGTTAVGPPYTLGPPYDSRIYYPISNIQGPPTGTSGTPTVFGFYPSSWPVSGQVTGILVPGSYGFHAAAGADAEAAPSEYYPTSDSQTASLTYSLTVYPTSIGVGGGSGGGNNSSNNPVLGINYDGTNLVVFWPVIYPNFLLTTTTNLASTNWAVVPIPPAIVGNLWQVTNSASVGTQFYRLLGQ